MHEQKRRARSSCCRPLPPHLVVCAPRLRDGKHAVGSLEDLGQALLVAQVALHHLHAASGQGLGCGALDVAGDRADL